MSKSDIALGIVIFFIIAAVLGAFYLAIDYRNRQDRANELRLFTRGAEAGCIAVLHLRGELDGIADCTRRTASAQSAYPDTDLLKILGGAE